MCKSFIMYWNFIEHKLKIYLIFSLVILTIISCKEDKKDEIRIYCAGSLARSFEKIAESFQKEHPGIKIKIEAYGSLEAVRRITELNKNPDIIAVSDYKLIEKFLIPGYANKNVSLVSNSMVICYTDNSALKEKINAHNWFEILLREKVKLGRSDPYSDPCGYRSLFVFELAELFYGKNGLSEDLKNKKNTFLRPKEVDLIALLETGNIDYLIIYKSVAVQHNLKFIELPDEINLSNPKYDDFYSKVCFNFKSERNETNTICGQTILYSYAVLKNSNDKSVVKKFIDFFNDREKGGKIFTKDGFIFIN